MMDQADLDALSLPEMIALSRALVLAISAAKAGGGSDFDCALLADAEGVSVTFSIPVAPAAGDPVAQAAGDQTTNPKP